MRTVGFLLNTALMAMLAASTANAATYAVNLQPGPGTVTGSITTDGTLGILATENIVDWLLVLGDGQSDFTLNGAANSQMAVFGSHFTATATALYFDFSSEGPLTGVIFQSPFFGAGQRYLCFNDIDGSCSANPGAIGFASNGALLHSAMLLGRTLVAGYEEPGVGGDGTAVPEPASWAMLITGFGLTGAMARRRRIRSVKA